MKKFSASLFRNFLRTYCTGKTPDLLVFGLGNDASLDKTRHSVGKICVNYLMDHYKLSRWSVGNTIVAETTIAGKHVTFVASASVMNLNGSTLFSCLSRLHYSVPNSNLLIVYDEINVPVGEMKLNLSGSGGGQKGMIDIIEKRGKDIPRLRIGIDKAPPGKTLANYVLSPFNSTEKQLIHQQFQRVPQILEEYLTKGPSKAMVLCNTKVEKK